MSPCWKIPFPYCNKTRTTSSYLRLTEQPPLTQPFIGEPSALRSHEQFPASLIETSKHITQTIDGDQMSSVTTPCCSNQLVDCGLWRQRFVGNMVARYSATLSLCTPLFCRSCYQLLETSFLFVTVLVWRSTSGCYRCDTHMAAIWMELLPFNCLSYVLLECFC